MKVTLQPQRNGNWLAMVGTDGRHGATQEEALGRLLLDFPDKLGVALEKVPEGELFPVPHRPSANRLGFIVRDLKNNCWHGRGHRYDRWNDVQPHVMARMRPTDYRKARIFASPTGVFTSLSRYNPGIKAHAWDDKAWAIYELTDQGPVPFPTPERWAVTFRKRAKKAVKGGLE